MDLKVTWSPEAIEDLESIAEFIKRDSEFYARAVVTKILETARAIKDFPFAGRIVPELGNENIRERIIYSYRLVYKIEKHLILIVAVIQDFTGCGRVGYYHNVCAMPNKRFAVSDTIVS